MAASIDCGFTASTTIAGRRSRSRVSASRCTMTSGRPAKAAAPGPGSTTMKRRALPRCSQPWSIAPPILPQPTSRTSAPPSFTRASRLPDRIDHRRGDRLVRRLAAPHDQLERRVEALALAERDVDEILDLLDAGAERSAQQHGMAESRRIVVRGEIEMAEPQLLVDR